MNKLTRRDFLGAAGVVLGAALQGCLQVGKSEKETSKAAKWHGFKYAMCNESMTGKSWRQQCRIVADSGYKGIEIAAFTLVKEGVHEKTPAQRKQMLAVMKDAGIECAGLHWLLAPPPKGLHFTTADKSVREKTIAYLDELIDFCGDLGGTVMIFGSPKQRNAVGTTVEQAGKYFVDGLTKVADHAAERGVKILVEPLDTSQTDVVNTMAEAMETVKQVGHPAIELMFDFHNTTDETEAFDLLINKFHEHIFHVHVQEMDGKHLGTGSAVDEYVKAFQALKDLKYDKWVSLEVFDFSPGGRTIAHQSMNTLRKIETKLI
ncbi:MAG: sugar phosphate isomerase/epimerase [Planctomycetota bacterium]|nr:MAG: sugar phosphate isomerase/epimerase [Planctomycetota bacterium]